MSESLTRHPDFNAKPTVPASWLAEAVLYRCQSCGVEAPTRQTTFNQHIGAVVIMFHREFRGRWCKRCIHQQFWSRTLITLFFGWWGLLSFFFTPVVLIANVVRYLAALGLEPPPRGATAGDRPSPNLLLEEQGDEIVEGIREGQTFGQLMHEVAEPLGAGRSQLATCLLHLVTHGRLAIEESPGGSRTEAVAALPSGNPPSGRTVGPGVSLAILGVMNLLWAALFTTIMLTTTDTSQPVKEGEPDVPRDAEGRRPLTPEERASNRVVGLGSAAVNSPAGLLLLLGGIQMVRRRWYSLAVAGSVTALMPLVTVCCFAGLPVGIWALVVLLNADVRATFT